MVSRKITKDGMLFLKTKKQLIEIIFRKDSVEVSSMNKIKQANERIAELEAHLLHEQEVSTWLKNENLRLMEEIESLHRTT